MTNSVPPASRRRRALALVVAPLAVLVVAVSVVALTVVPALRDSGGKPDTPGSSAPPSPLGGGAPLGYAYTTATELVVRPVAKEPIRVPGAYRGGALFFTRTGTFVVAAAVGTRDEQSLAVVNTDTGAVRWVSCQCASAAAVGGDRIAYVDGATGEALVLDLHSGEATALPATLPEGRKATEVMASGADMVLLRGQLIPPGADAPEYTSPDVLYAVRVGDPTPHEVARHAMIVGSTAVGGTGPDESARFGVSVPDDDGRCNSSTYWLYDSAEGKAVKPPSLVQSAPGEDAWMTVTDWWWDDGGTLHASLSSHRCTDTFDEEMTAPPTLWRLDGAQWSVVDQTAAQAVRPIGAGVVLLLQQRGGLAEFRLSRRDATGTNQLADQVIEVATAPAKPDPKSTGAPAKRPIDGTLLRQLGVCKLACEITGRVEFEHPAWGAVTLVTAKAAEENRDAAIAVLDAEQTLKWSHWGGDWYVLEPADPGQDATGNVFLNYNPGRYNGVIILRPAADGFDDLGTLPRPDDYQARFYGAEVKDVDGDGRYEVQTEVNDCEPSCAEGTVHRATLHWDGKDYTE